MKSRQWHLVVLSGMWFIIALSWISLEPRFSVSFTNLSWFANQLPLLITALLIISNTAFALSILFNAGRDRPALPNSLSIFVLFVLLFMQIARHLGASQYEVSHATGLFDWSLFAIEHLLRAADIVDTLSEYGIQDHTIHVKSHISAAALIAFRMITDVILLKIVFDIVRRWFARSPVNRMSMKSLTRIVLRATVLFWFLAWTATVFWWKPWERADIGWWLAQNVVNVADFPDIMLVYGVRWHAVPDALWEGFLGVVLRVVVAILLARHLSSIEVFFGLTLFRGRLMTIETLEEAVTDDDLSPRRRKIAAARLKHLQQVDDVSHGLSLVQRPSWLWSRASAAVMSGLLIVWLLTWLTSFGVVRRLAEAVAQPPGPQSSNALAILERLGPVAEDAIPVIDTSLKADTTHPQTRLQLVGVLGSLGERADEVLEETLSRNPQDEVIGLAAVASLVQRGPEAAACLSPAWDHASPRVREDARAAIKQFGFEATDALARRMTDDNSSRLLSLLVESDPYWFRHQVDNPVFVRLCEEYTKLQQTRGVIDSLIHSWTGFDSGITLAKEFVSSLPVELSGRLLLDEFMRLERAWQAPQGQKLLAEWDSIRWRRKDGTSTPHRIVRSQIAAVLQQNRDTFTELLSKLRDIGTEDDRIAAEALLTLIRQRTEEQELARNAVIRFPKADSVEKQIELLRLMRQGIAEDVQTIAEQTLTSHEIRLQREAAEVLLSVGKMNDDAVEVLADDYLGRVPEDWNRIWAALDAEAKRPAWRETLLAKALEHPSLTVRMESAGRHSESQQVALDLAKLAPLELISEDVTGSALAQLARLVKSRSPDAETALPILRKLTSILSEESDTFLSHTWENVFECLSEYGSDAIPALTEIAAKNGLAAAKTAAVAIERIVSKAEGNTREQLLVALRRHWLVNDTIHDYRNELIASVCVEVLQRTGVIDSQRVPVNRIMKIDRKQLDIDTSRLLIRNHVLTLSDIHGLIDRRFYPDVVEIIWSELLATEHYHEAVAEILKGDWSDYEWQSNYMLIKLRQAMENSRNSGFALGPNELTELNERLKKSRSDDEQAKLAEMLLNSGGEQGADMVLAALQGQSSRRFNKRARGLILGACIRISPPQMQIIEEIMMNSEEGDSLWFHSLAKLGPNAVPVYVRTSTLKPTLKRRYASETSRRYLAQVLTDNPVAVRRLLDMLTIDNADTRQAAARLTMAFRQHTTDAIKNYKPPKPYPRDVRKIIDRWLYDVKRRSE